jgi:hypothetical protein
MGEVLFVAFEAYGYMINSNADAMLTFMPNDILYSSCEERTHHLSSSAALMPLGGVWNLLTLMISSKKNLDYLHEWGYDVSFISCSTNPKVFDTLQSSEAMLKEVNVKK